MANCSSLVFVILLTFSAQAQKVFSPGGKSASNGSIRLDYTIGEPIFATKSNATNTLTQGFQQPGYQLITRVPASLDEVLAVSVYPNPTSGSFTLQVNGAGGLELAYELLDITGKSVLPFTKMVGEFTTLDVSGLPAGTYFIWIRQALENRQAIFPIVKSN